MFQRLERGALRALRRLDQTANRLYGWKYNPLYQTGTLVVLLFLVLLVTGVYLLLFYRVGSPWESVATVTRQPWGGRWIRTLHRYASDVAVVAIGLHAFRMFAQGRSWGPRVLAWVSGGILAAVFLVCGWTGYVMVWDAHGWVIAREGARLLDVLPLFSEPVSRAFTGPDPLPGAFFFMNLFLHIALPIGLGILLWLHVSRIARPILLPPRRLAWGAVALLTAFSLAWPIGMGEPAPVLELPRAVPLDVFFGFWVPLARALPAWISWLAIASTAVVGLVLVPRWSRPPEDRRPPPSRVNERYCTACVQCSIDCPYEAISMIPREDGRFDRVARVDPERCVSCGICAGSCAPMGVGPPGRTGRDQLERARAFLRDRSPERADIVVLGCTRSGDWASLRAFSPRELPSIALSCVGSLHTSTVELLIRGGVPGVAIVSCAPRDCWNREGVVWAEARLFHDREAELKPRVDRRRVALIHAANTGPDGLRRELEAFRERVRALGREPAEADIELDVACETGTPDGTPATLEARG